MSNRRRKTMFRHMRCFAIASVLVMVALMLGACGTPVPEVQTPVPEEPKPTEAVPVTLRIGVTPAGFWSTVNPLVDFSWGPRPLIYEQLTQLKTNTSVQPALAESWEANEDSTVWTFKIREGVTFHDGTPCNAEDIAWSLNFMMENEFPASAAYVGNFKEVKALDPTTLQITLKTPDQSVPEAKVIYAWILPRSVWEGMTYDEATGLTDMKALIGTGPYKLVDYVESEYLILEAFDDYWWGRPPIDRIVFRIYANEDAMVEAIVSGEVDMLDSVPAHAVERLQEAENVEVVFLPKLSTWYLMLNSYEGGTQPRSLFDPVVRKAIEYATDRQKIITVGFLGYAEIGTIPAPPGFGDLHNPNIEPLPFDPDEGNRILDEAGYLDTDGDGIREWKDGSPLEYRMFTDEGATGMRMLEVVADGLAEMDIQGTPQEIDSMDALYPDYDFDMAIWNWGWDPNIDESLRSYTCAEVPDGWNDCGWCDPKYDELYAQQSDPTLSYEERREIIWEMQKMFYEGRCYITWFYPKGIAAYRSDRFTGFVTDRFDMLWQTESLMQAGAVR
jgi:peptide/nickel transport system substrate-binding protein